MLRDARFIAFQDLSHMLRQRETLLWTFLLPPVFFLFIGTVMGGLGAPPAADASVPIAVVAHENPDIVLDVLIERLEGHGYRVTRFGPGHDSVHAGPAASSSTSASAESSDVEVGPDANADEVVRRLDEFSRQLRVPPLPEGCATVTDAVVSGQQVELEFIRTGDDLAAGYDKVRVARAVYGVLADLAVLRLEAKRRAAGGSDEGQAGQDADASERRPERDVKPPEVTRDSFDNLAAMPRKLSLVVETAGRREEPPSGFAQAIPGIIVMFTMLIMLTSGSVLLVVERNQGLLRRLASTPIASGSVVLGKWLARTVLAVVQVAYGMILGALAFRLEWGGALPVLLLVLLAWAGFCASFAMLLANFARTEAQMAGIGVLSTMALAALGGCWWPIEITPGWMQSLALFLPTGWTMDAIHKLVSFGYGGGAALPHLSGLTAGAVILGVAAARSFRYE